MRMSLGLAGGRLSGGWRSAKLEGLEPLLVGKEVIISDPVSGLVETVNHGSHAINFGFFWIF